MAHRTFRDSLGREWEVWAVSVSYLERRADSSGSGPGGRERRRRASFRQRMAAPWSGGWLTFETKGEKRRLAAFPSDWAERTDAELAALCAKGIAVSTSRRLID